MDVSGRLARVSVRDIWPREANGFTPWLAKEENLHLLGEGIGMPLIFESQEKPVGIFRADILARNAETGEWVRIENQLERTNHGHLGQLITYAAGLKAVSIVWIACQFTDEHRAALDWLNEITDKNISFFGLEMELWRIGQSEIAPKFNLISRPNTFSKMVNRVVVTESVDKGECIRLFLAEHPDWKNADIIRAAAAQGLTISPAHVSQVRASSKQPA